MIALGVDVVETSRIRKLVEQHKDHFTRLVLTAQEQQVASAEARLVTFVAGRWAAKEAVMKALGKGIGDINFTEIEVLRLPGGEPSVLLNGRALEYAQQKGIERWHISISHERNMAVAVAAAD